VVANRKRLTDSEIEIIVKDRPYALEVIQTQILYDIAGMLDEATERLINLERLLSKPKGYVYSLNVTVDKLMVVDFLRDEPYSLLYSITIYNDGPDSVYPSINIYQKKTSLKPGESLHIDYQSPKIEKLYLDIDSDKKANVRVFAVY
jgi:hypothetical protein